MWWAVSAGNSAAWVPSRHGVRSPMTSLAVTFN